MAILSDRWIKNQCVKPTHIRFMLNGNKYFISGKLSFEEEIQLNIWNEFQNNTPKPPPGAKEETPMDLGLDYVRPVTEKELAEWKPMIDPFIDHSVGEEVVGMEKMVGGTSQKRKVLSYGLSSYGYDVRVAPEFRIFTNVNNTVVDPLDFDTRSYVEVEGDKCIVPPNSFVLTRTIETIRVPRNVLVDVLTKSTMARIGTHTLATPLEPEWYGQVTLEFANTTPLPAVLHANMGGVQLRFFEGNEPCETSYSDRSGKYQNQEGIVNPR